MDGGIVLIVLLVLGVPLVVAIWLIVRAINAANDLKELSRRLGYLELEVLRLKKQGEQEP